MQQDFKHKAALRRRTTGAELIRLWAVLGWLALRLPIKTKISSKRRWALTAYWPRVMLCLVIIIAITAWMTTAQAGILKISDVGTATSTAGGPPYTVSVTVPAAGVAAGNSIIVVFAMQDVSGTVSCSDDAGNSYGPTGAGEPDADVTNNNNVRLVIFSAHNVTALGENDTITVTHPGPTDRAMTVVEFSGLSASSTLDKTKTNAGFQFGMTTLNTQLTSDANELLIGGFGLAGPSTDSITPDSGPGSGYYALNGTGINNTTVWAEWDTVTSTGTYAATATNNNKRKYAAAIATYKGLPATVDQAHYRWREDDGSEAAASWWADEDTKANIGKGVNQRLRFLVENEGAYAASTMTYRLQVAEITGAETCADGSYSDVLTGASGDWQIVNTTNLTDGNPTTNVGPGDLTDPAQFTFVAGEVKDQGNTTGDITLGIDRFTEIEYAIRATGNADEGNDYCFRLYNASGAGAPLDKYTAYAEATIGCEFEYRRLLTIDKDQVGLDNNPGTLSNFPVLVSLSGNWLKTTATDPVNGRIENANGWDIVFRYDDGSCITGNPCGSLDHEIEKYDGTTGELIAWVRHPSVSKSADTDFYIYYGNSCVGVDPQNADGVWDANYKGVWHLKEDPEAAAPQFLDSTANPNDGTANSLATANQVTGQIDGSLQFDDTNERHVSVADHSSLQLAANMAISAWVNTTDAETDVGVIVNKWSSGTSARNYWLGKLDQNSVAFYVDDTQNVTASLSLINDGNWHHVTGVADVANSLLRIYVDGVQRNTAAYSGSSRTGTNELHIGHSSGEVLQEFDGIIDEVRVSNFARTADWIKTDYNNQYDPTKDAACTDNGFICQGSEEANPPTAITLISFAAKGDLNHVRIDWQTGQEIRNLGFNLYRSTSASGPFVKINDSLIPGLNFSVKGKSYSYVDEDVFPGTLYYYKLEDIDASGKRTFHGPICVDWDDDSMPDDWEIAHGLNPWINDAAEDADNDGLTNLQEYELGFNPLNPDSDGDGILDGQEARKQESLQANGSWQLSRGVEVIAEDENGLTLQLHTETYVTKVVTAGGQEFERLRIAEYVHGYTREVGHPQVPLKGILVDLPQGKSLELSILQTTVETHSGFQIFPVPEHIIEDQSSIAAVGESFVWDQSAYAVDEFYPTAAAQLGEVFVFRGQGKQQLLFYPLSFNPASGQLKLHRKIRVRIDYVDMDSNLANADGVFSDPWQLPINTETSGGLSSIGSMAMALGAAPMIAHPIAPVLSSLSVLVNALWTPDTGAQGAAYKIYVTEAGIYRLTRDYLAANGVDVDALDLSQIRIYNLGEEIAIDVVDQNSDDALDPTDYIQFYGQPAAAAYAKYASANVYWLVTAGGSGTPKRMAVIDGTPAAGPMAAFHDFSVLHEEDEYYVGLAPGADSRDRWYFDDFVLGTDFTGTENPVPVEFTISLPGVAGQGNLRISLWGYYDTYHEVAVWINGTYKGTFNWNGIAFYEINIQDTDLLDGDNTVTLACNTAFDGIIVDWMEVTYPRFFEATNNFLTFSHDSGNRYLVNGFDAGNLAIYDITQATDVARVVNFEVSGNNPYSVEFEPPVNAGATETYLVLAPDATLVPTGLIADAASDLSDTANGADYILITHRDLGWDANGDAYPWLNDLAALREGQGLRVKVVDVQDIYDEFGYGMTSAEAIRDFLAYAYANWKPAAPQYVLLVGDATYDLKDHLNLGTTNLVPAYLTYTDFMGETVTDEWYARIDGEDAIPDLYIGRLPAETHGDAAVMVNKILAYQGAANTKTWEKNVVLIADNQTEAYEVYFRTMNDSAAAMLPGAMNAPFKGYLDDYLSAADLADDIKTAINAGALIVNYSGHAALQQWAAEGLFQNDDVENLTNTGMYPFFVSMSCLNGYFAYLDDQTGPEPSLAEALLKADSKGAVAALMPTAMTEPEGQHILDTALFEAIFTKDMRKLGPAVADAKQILLANGGAAFEEISETFLLFGDPALTLKIPFPYKPTQVEAERTPEGVVISWNAALDANGNPVAGYNVYRSSAPGGNYSKINFELITETRYVVSAPGVVGVSSAGGGGGGSSYYAVTSVDDAGDESAQSLGVSPALLSASGGGGLIGCFIGSVAQPMPYRYLWLPGILLTGLLVGIRFKKDRRQKTEDR